MLAEVLKRKDLCGAIELGCLRTEEIIKPMHLLSGAVSGTLTFP